MNKLKIVNQPLRISDIDLYELDDESQDYRDHKTESMEISRIRSQRKSFKVEARG